MVGSLVHTLNHTRTLAHQLSLLSGVEHVPELVEFSIKNIEKQDAKLLEHIVKLVFGVYYHDEILNLTYHHFSLTGWRISFADDESC